MSTHSILRGLILALSVGTMAHAADLFFIGAWRSTYILERDDVLEFKPGGVFQRKKSYGAIEEGAWKFGDGVCWRSSDPQDKGNLMVYEADGHGCYYAQLVGSRLILSCRAGDCRNRTLVPHKPQGSDSDETE